MLIFTTEHDADFKEGKLNEILASKITGVLVYEAMSDNLCNKIIALIDYLKATFFTDLNYSNGFSLPIMFGQLYQGGPVNDCEKYFKQIPDFLRKVNEELEINLASYLQDSFYKFFSPYFAEPLPAHLPFSIRVLHSGRGGLFMHIDKELLSYIYKEVGEKLKQLIQPDSMMSWFYTIQSPEKGGELWVSDSRYDNCKKEGQFHLKDEMGNLIHEDEMENIKVSTPKGSLIMFKGGNYWHKVIAPVKGYKERITLGGFMALSSDGSKIYYWS